MADLASSNLTWLGNFFLADPAGDGAGTINYTPPIFTVRNIAGQDYIYAFSYTKKTVEMIVPDDGDLTFTAPFPTAVESHTFGDIFQDEIYRHASGPSEPPNTGGLANNVFPNWFFWDEASQKLYWGRYVIYQTGTEDYDTVIGRGTIDRGAETGVGEGMWGLAYNGAPTEDATNVGGRWISGCANIPQAFIDAYLPAGRRLLTGFGQPSTSILTVGPTQMGISLFAVDPVQLGSTTNHTVLGGTNLTKLAAHPCQGFNPTTPPMPQTRAGVFQVLIPDSSEEAPFADTNQISVFSDQFGGGVWIDGSARSGIIIPAILGNGNNWGTIQASPAPSGTSFTLDHIGDTQVGDLIWVKTDLTAGDSPYPFSSGSVTNITGNRITCNAFTRRSPPYGSDTSQATVGQWCQTGARYQGGGSFSSRFNVVLQFYSIDDLAAVAQGSIPASEVNPIEIVQIDIPGLTQPAQLTQLEKIAAAYSPATKRLYVYTHWLYIQSGFAYNQIQVYSVDADGDVTTHTITASVTSGSGTISPSGFVSVVDGSNRTFTMTPSSGWHISDVLVDTVSVGAVSTYPFINITADHTIEVIFLIDSSDNTSCENATLVSLPFTITTDTTGAPDSPTHPDCGSGNSYNSIWYKYVAGGGITRVTVEITDEDNLELVTVFSGPDCDDLTPTGDCIHSGDGPTVIITVPGDTYWFLITSSAPGGAPALTFSLSLPTPSGQFCTDLSCGTLPVASSGLYYIQPGKTNDTLYVTFDPVTTQNVKIP